MPSYQYRKSHCGGKTVVRSSFLHNGNSYTGKMTSLYWISPWVLYNVAVSYKWILNQIHIPITKFYLKTIILGDRAPCFVTTGGRQPAHTIKRRLLYHMQTYGSEIIQIMKLIMFIVKEWYWYMGYILMATIRETHVLNCIGVNFIGIYWFLCRVL